MGAEDRPMLLRQEWIFSLAECDSSVTEERSSDRFIMCSGGRSNPVIDRMGQKVLDRDAVATDEQDPLG